MAILKINIRFLIMLLAMINLTLVKVSAQNISPYLNRKNFKENKKYAVEFSGIINTNLAHSSQKNTSSNRNLADGFSKNYQEDVVSAGLDNQSFIKGGFKINDNNHLGIIAKIELNYNSNSRKEHPNLDQFFGYLENPWGKIELGNFLPVNQRLKTGPASFARGAGGINGKYLEHVYLPVLSQNNSLCGANILSNNCRNLNLPRFITLAQSPIGHGGYAKGFYPRDVDNIYGSPQQASYFNRHNFRALKDNSYEGLEDALKFSFLSKRVNQWQLGLSYAPRSHNQGFTAKTAPDSKDFRLNNLWSMGLNYVNDVDNWHYSFSSTAEYGQAQSLSAIQRKDLLSYDIGATASYFGFSLGASVGSWGKSLSAKNGVYSCFYAQGKNLANQDCATQNNQLKNSYYYTTGLAYEIGPIKSSITSINSNFQNNKYQAISFGVDYKIQKNLIAYLEITGFNFKNNPALLLDINNQTTLANSANNINNNSGKVLLSGIYYMF